MILFSYIEGMVKIIYKDRYKIFNDEEFESYLKKITNKSLKNHGIDISCKRYLYEKISLYIRDDVEYMLSEFDIKKIEFLEGSKWNTNKINHYVNDYLMELKNNSEPYFNHWSI